jgi:hypothetical protein
MIFMGLVGGEFDGLRFEAAESVARLFVPLVFNYGDGPVLESVEKLVYEDTRRSTGEGRRLYRFERHAVTPLSSEGEPAEGG